MRPLVLICLTAACAPGLDTREVELVGVLARADDIALRSRPQLVEGKYARMASTLYSYYRGNLAVFRHDWENGRLSAEALPAAMTPVWGLGDPHPENFGILLAADGSPGFEPNDFDAADRVPAIFDLRRLTLGLVLGAKEVDADPTGVVQAAVRAYATTLSAHRDGQGLGRVEAPTSPILNDLFNRSIRDANSRAELAALVTADAPNFRLGILDPDEPTQHLAPLPAELHAGLQALVHAEKGASPEWELLDAARMFGSGVSSWPRVRVLLLLEGPTAERGDELVLELKELSESPLAGWYRPALPAVDLPRRITEALRRAWSRPDADPHWFTTAWLGVPVQLRTESEGQKNTRVSRWEGARGTPEALAGFAATAASVLARVHAQTSPEATKRLADAFEANLDAVAEVEARFARREAEAVERDWQLFQGALNRLGPRLGMHIDPRDLPTGMAALIFGAQR